MALSDVYMLRDFQVVPGETLMNVFFYQDLLLASNAQVLVEAYIAGVIPKAQAIQNSNLIHTLVDAVNLADPSNFFESRIEMSGFGSGDMLPIFNATTFALRLNSRALRPGSKRIAGVSESDQSNGSFVGSTILTAIEAYRVQMKSVLMSGVLLTFQPIVVKRVPYDVPDTSPVRTAYRLPETEGEFVFGNVIECLTTGKVSHQTSRGI